jgi:3-methyl-2-oxobutanoate hydroxymethyltransferase
MTTQITSDRKKNTIRTLRQKKKNAIPISMITAYDYPSALLIDQAGLDVILVGDSLGMVVLGYENTLPVTMQDMLHHCKAVARGTRHALLVGDMPFLSYQVSVSDAVRNAGRFLQEAGMDAVKLEGGSERLEAIRAINQAGIPVMGHLGLTPQSVQQFGGFLMQGKNAEAAAHIYFEALRLQDAGCFSIVLESIPSQVAMAISQKLDIPTIGIGAGADCDGQVLVLHDVLGWFDQPGPSFAKTYIQIHKTITSTLEDYRDEVEKHAFPGPDYSRNMNDQEWEKFQNLIATHT